MEKLSNEYGGSPPNDLASKELLEYLNNCSSYNPVLGTPDDPRYDSYKEFLKQIGGGGEPPES